MSTATEQFVRMEMPTVESEVPVRTNEPGSAWPVFCYALAALLTGRGIQLTFGNYSVRALAWIGLAVIAALSAQVRVSTRMAALAKRALEPCMILGIGAGAMVHLRYSPFGITGPGQILAFKVCIIASLACVLSGLKFRKGSRTMFSVAVLLWAMCGALTLQSSHPLIDVIAVHHESAANLLAGKNPFAGTLPVVYGADKAALYYAPDEIKDGRLQHGFPYPPLSLLMAVPGEALAGDYRYTLLLSIALAALLMTWTSPGIAGGLAAAAFLFTPQAFFVLAMGWTEPFLVLLLALTVFAAARRSSILPYAFGLFLSGKQYMAIAAIAAAALVKPLQPRNLLSFLVKAGLAASFVTVPFFLWNPSAFAHSVLRATYPDRLDALSFPSLFLHMGIHLPGWVLALPLLLTLIFLARRGQATPSGFAALVATLYLVLFSFARVAFCNYYYFVIAAFCIAIAGWQTDLSSLNAIPELGSSEASYSKVIDEA